MTKKRAVLDAALGGFGLALEPFTGAQPASWFLGGYATFFDRLPRSRKADGDIGALLTMAAWRSDGVPVHWRGRPVCRAYVSADKAGLPFRCAIADAGEGCRLKESLGYGLAAVALVWQKGISPRGKAQVLLQEIRVVGFAEPGLETQAVKDALLVCETDARRKAGFPASKPRVLAYMKACERDLIRTQRDGLSTLGLIGKVRDALQGVEIDRELDAIDKMSPRLKWIDAAGNTRVGPRWVR